MAAADVDQHGALMADYAMEGLDELGLPYELYGEPENSTEEKPAEKNGELAQTDPTGERSADSDSEFVKAAIPAYSYDWSKEWGYDELVSNFYIYLMLFLCYNTRRK